MDLFPQTERRDSLIVDTTPADARNQGSINLGLEIVAKAWKADVCSWPDTVNPALYSRIGFNVYYPMHLLNIGPFMRLNGLLGTRKAHIVAGGQGLGINHILKGIVDEEFYGEIDYQANASKIVSDAVIKNGKAAIEISRGCRMLCAFCEYAGTQKSYREKDIELVKEQVKEIRRNGIRRVNFLSANFAGYSKLDELMECVVANGIQVLNCDSCATFIPRLYPWLKQLPKMIKIGVESFDPETRNRIGKKFSDEFLSELIENLIAKDVVGIHMYLIYGLQGDNYDTWFQWQKKLGDLRKRYTESDKNLFGETETRNTKNIRFEFNITNFEPSAGTPLANAPEVDFVEKAKFLESWTAGLFREGFRRGDKAIEYKTARGRFGRKELSYKMLMMLKKGGPELTDRLLNALPKGIGRSVSDEEAERFLQYSCKTSA